METAYQCLPGTSSSSQSFRERSPSKELSSSMSTNLSSTSSPSTGPPLSKDLILTSPVISMRLSIGTSPLPLQRLIQSSTKCSQQSATRSSFASKTSGTDSTPTSGKSRTHPSPSLSISLLASFSTIPTTILRPSYSPLSIQRCP